MLAWPRDSPLVPRHAGHPTGDRAWAWWFFWLLIAAFAVYVAGLLLVRSSAPRVALVGAIAVATQLAPLAAPLLLSTDAWTYWDEGRIAVVDGGNPYRDAPGVFPHDPAFPHVGSAWRETTTVYGPAFTLASEPIARAAGSSAGAAAWIYKTLAALAVLACALLAARLSPRPALALALVGWNPLLAVHFAGGGHNDSWMAALVVAALAAAAAGRRQLAGVFWALGALVKWVPLVLLPLRMLEARASGRHVGHRGFALTAITVGALATWRYGFAWLHAFGSLARNANQETHFSFPHRLQQLGLPHGAAVALLVAAFAIAYAWLAREALRGRARLGLATVALLAASPYLAVWYVVWTLPLAAAEDDERAALLGLALCAYLLRQTIPL
ncbi:MAG: glycosyltransferase 87 family protein [Gaiellaceae bacterium]